MAAKRQRSANERFFQLDLRDALCFGLPWLRLVQVQLGGQLYGTDVVVLLLLFLMLPARRDILNEPSLRAILIGCGVFLLGAVASDLYQSTAFVDWSRGWAKILLFSCNFVVLAMICEGQGRRLILYVAGTALAICAENVIMPNDFFIEEPWKFGYGIPFTTLLILAVESPRFVRFAGRAVGVALVLGMGALSFALNARSLFGITLVCAVLGGAKLLLDPSEKGIHVPNEIFVPVIVICCGLGWGLLEFQNWMAISGYVGYDAQLKALNQANTDLGLLFGGRIESLASTQAIKDSPILGHGSWARNISYVGLLLDQLVLSGAQALPKEVIEDDLIPSHSILLGAWVEAGILGALFWGWLLAKGVVSMRAIFAVPVTRPMLTVFLVLGLLWDILFSPFGADRRLTIPATVILIFATIAEERRRAGPDASRSAWRIRPAGRRRSAPLRERSPAGA